MSRRVKILWRVVLALVALLIVGAGVGVLVLRSDWFREKVRVRMISEIESATGGRAEIGNFAFNWSSLVATVQPLVLHGTEPAGEAPLLRVESIEVGLRIISMLKRQVDLSFIRIHGLNGRVVIRADGSTNLPRRAASRARRRGHRRYWIWQSSSTRLPTACLKSTIARSR